MKTIKNLKAEEIRKSILQLAIQGKLVKQDPNDEPASELVKRIYEEKNRLIKEGKIKKDKNESYIFKGDDNCYYEKVGKNAPIKLEDLPFDIPDSWVWIRLKSFADIYTGNSINETEKRTKYTNIVGRDYIGTKDVGFDRVISYNNGINIPYDSDFRIAPANKILLCIEGGSAGRKIAITDREVNFGNKLACFNSFIVNDLYLLNILQSSEFFKIFRESLTGIIGGVSINTLKEFLVPLPPIQEQKRIVKKMDLLEPLITEYGNYEDKLSSLESLFPEKLKKSILQYAIEGKLVKQDPNDEPASVLLERIKVEKEALIKAGKIKRDKNESVIYQGDDRNYYENLPNNWVVIKLKEALLPMTSRKPQGDNFRYIDIEAVDNKNNIIRKPKLLKTENAPSRASREVKEGDVLFSIVRPYLKNVAIVTKEFSDCIATTGFYVCRPSKIIETEFLFYYLLSPMCIDSVMPYMKGDNSPSIRGENLEELLIALPTLEIQRKVCAKVNNLLLKIGG